MGKVKREIVALGRTAITLALGLAIAAGPALAADLAALVVGKNPDKILKIAAIATPIQAMMSEVEFADVKDLAANGLQSKFEEVNGFVKGSACEPHNCGDHDVVWVFDHAGHVWTLLKADGRDAVYFGNPPKEVEDLLY
ncbi:MAG: hypothetical protein WDN69_12045 [Aliidongia sp.]